MVRAPWVVMRLLLLRGKSEIRGNKDMAFCVPDIIWIRRRQSQKPRIMTARASGVIREALFWDDEKKIVLSFKGTTRVLQ